MKKKILILGAGFGGFELSSRLPESLADQVKITLIDKNEGFIFRFSKFDLMLGHAKKPEVTFFYNDISKPSVDFRQETILSIDPVNRIVKTDKQTYETDVLVVALAPGTRSKKHLVLPKAATSFTQFRVQSH